MRTKQRKFTESEDGYIRAHYREVPARDIARHLDRSVQQIRKRARRIGLAVPIKRWRESEDRVIRSSWRKRQLADVAEELGRSVSEVSSRSKKLGLDTWRKPGKGTHSGRPIDGFDANGNPVFTHRRVMAEELGRPLRSHEMVHHIDFDKSNNDPGNLHLFSSRSEHRSAHCSFEAIVPELVERGIVVFERSRGVYRLCETDK